ncbi:MAG TPA: dephospho-CoA kinase [Flavobacterium sp.]|nr:dephospho-CoA kinase [Flavobacterium sp.]
MAKIIGLTGGIGSGKTTVAHYFHELGVPVYIADSEAKRITDSPEIKAAIIEAFGQTILDEGRINREKLAAIVFNNPENLALLNGIIHPAVRKDFANWIELHKGAPIVIKETAILFESGSDSDCDAIITVTAPIETRIQRVMERDKTTRESIIKRIENQWTDQMRTSKSDYVIDNVEITKTKQQVREILKKLHNF